MILYSTDIKKLVFRMYSINCGILRLQEKKKSKKNLVYTFIFEVVHFCGNNGLIKKKENKNNKHFKKLTVVVFVEVSQYLPQ